MTSIFLTTCSRCGTHWVKFQLKALLGLTEHNLHAGDGDFEAQISKLQALEQRTPGAKIYAHHTPLYLLKDAPSSVRVIALVRDMRDVTVSAAHWYVKTHNQESRRVQRAHLKGIVDFGDVHSVVDWLIKTGHNLFWWQGYQLAENVPHTLMRYEDMHAQPAATIRHTLEAAKVAFPPGRVDQIVRDWGFRRLSGGRDRGDERVRHHYRKGVVGDWRNYATAAKWRAFYRRFRGHMEPFGYGEDGEIARIDDL